MQDREVKAGLSSLSEDEQTRYKFCARRNDCDSDVDLAGGILDRVTENLCESLGLPETLIKSDKARGGSL